MVPQSGSTAKNYGRRVWRQLGLSEGQTYPSLGCKQRVPTPFISVAKWVLTPFHVQPQGALVSPLRVSSEVGLAHCGSWDASGGMSSEGTSRI